MPAKKRTAASRIDQKNTMKHQEVSVDYWSMLKAMLMYGALTVLGWIMMRLFSTVFTLPRRMRAQQDQIQHSLAEMQRRFPDLNITEEDLKNAEQELEAFIKEEDEKKVKENAETSENKEITEKGESSKTKKEETGSTETEAKKAI